MTATFINAETAKLYKWIAKNVNKTFFLKEKSEFSALAD